MRERLDAGTSARNVNVRYGLEADTTAAMGLARFGLADVNGTWGNHPLEQRRVFSHRE